MALTKRHWTYGRMIGKEHKPVSLSPVQDTPRELRRGESLATNMLLKIRGP
jgi:hypothetical protein